MTAKAKPVAISKDVFEQELQRVLRRAAKLRAVINGDATVSQYWREGYREKKLREYKGHWVTIITVGSKPRKTSGARAILKAQKEKKV